MLVIHPTDPTTSFLSILYEGMEDIRVLHGTESRNKLNDILYHLRPGETIMLLGHGSDAGLFRLEKGLYTLYVGRSMAYCLRRHPVIGVFCHSRHFAEPLRLHGLFTGMVISELEEANMYDIQTTEAELERENRLFASTLDGFLRSGLPFSEIPVMMRRSVGNGPAVRDFNYRSFIDL